MKMKKAKSKRKVDFRLSPLVISLLSVYPQATVFAQGIVVDPSQNNGLNVTVTANDTPLIQIADPNAKGVSYNKFTDFNVSNPGVVFNNSMEDGISQIGGMAIKNPNLTKAATGVITEVTGANASRLEGTLEVFGQKSDLIIANENGINVNGVSTINTGNLTLSTGKVQQQSDGDYMLSVERGNVTVESGGISTVDLDYFGIVSRSATLNGKISGKAEVKVLTGSNDYDLQDRSHRVRSTQGSGAPEIAISGSSMGSMYGNRIQLISTESGAGVRHEGSIISIGDIEISTSGDISLAGLQAGQDIAVSGENITQLATADSSGFSAQRDLFVDALGHLTLRSGLVSQQGIRINAASLLQQASVIQANGGAVDVDTITINVIGDYTLSGKLSALDANGNPISNAVITLRDGSYVVSVNGWEVAYSSVISDVGVNTKQGNITIKSASIDNQQGSFVADAGTLVFNVSDVFSSSGIIRAKGDIALVSRSLVNNGIAYSSSKLDINVSDLTNHGSLAAEGSLNVAASNARDNRGTVSGNQSVTLAGDKVTNTGSLVSQDTLNVTTKDLLNEGKVHAAKDMTLSVESTLTNRGRGEIVSGDALVIHGQDATIDNSGDATIQAKNLTLTGINSLKNSDSAQMLITERLIVDRLNNLNNGGLIQAADLVLNDIGTLNNDGQLIATSTLLLLANSVKNQGILQGETRLSINASVISNTGGTIQAGGEMLIEAAELQNVQGGNLFSSEDMVLTLSKALNNTASVIASGGTLTIKGVNNARTLTVHNSEGAELSATNVILADLASLTNTDARIGATDDLNINNLNSLVNQGDDALIQAMVSDLNQISNTGAVYADSRLTLENAASLDNTGMISTDGDLTINMIKQVDNAGELLASGHLQITQSTALTNSGAITSDRLTLDNITRIDSSHALKVMSQLDIKKIDNLTNSGLVYSGGTLTIEDVVRFINTSASEAETEARVVAEAEMVIQRISELVNSGDTAVINAYGRLQLLDIAQLANSGRAVISGELALILDKVGVLTNLSAANISSQNGSVSITADTIKNSGTYVENVYNADGILINQLNYSSLIYALNDLTIKTDTLNNFAGAVVSTDVGNLSISSAALNNNQGSSVSSRGDINIDISNYINNTTSLIYGRDMAITTDKLYNASSGEITATNNALLSLNILDHDGGRIFASKNLELDINNNFTFGEASLNANDNLIINAVGNITNANRIENYGSLLLHAGGGFVNESGGSLVSAGDVEITAANFASEENTLLWSLGNLSIDVRNGAFVNKQNGHIYSNKAMSLIARSLLNHAGYIKSGTDMEIDAQELTNKSIYDSQGWSLGYNAYFYNLYQYKTSGIFVNEDYVEMLLPLWQADITLVGKAEIGSGGNLIINKQGLYDNIKVTNTGGLLSSARDMFIWGDLLNEPEYIKMTFPEYMQTEFDIKLQHAWYGAGSSNKIQTVEFKTLYNLLDYVYGNATAALDHNDTFYYVLLGLEKRNNPFEQIMTRLFGETWRNLTYDNMKSRWAEVIQNDGAIIAAEVVYFLPSDTGSITVGGSFNHQGGTFSNGITDGGVVETNKVVEVDIGDKTVNTTDVGAQVVVNQKVLAEVSMGISTLPTVAQLTNIPGMFGRSEAFKKMATGMVAPEDIGSVGAIIVVIGDTSLTVVPMYETRLNMIDKSQFYGSDYFFKQIGYVSEAPVSVVGDAYFINELINRQISTSVGSFFAVRDGLDGEALAKDLMDNAAKVADEMGLVVGEALTEEQRNNLTEDIVWFITSRVDGFDVLTPVVYLSAESQQQLRDGGASAVIHANQDVNIGATSINSANGLISASENVSLVSEGDITNTSSGRDSGVKAGGNILMDSSDGDINVSGSYIESGGDIDINAENGDISFIASMNRDDNGNQVLHSNNDGITAGGNMTISGNNVEFNAVDIEVGGDAGITATDGSVSFNALTEITSDREIAFENNGLLSDERTDTQSISGTAVTSNITVGGNLSITANEDINIEGSEMTASSGELTAGNDINITTAEDVNLEKNTVEKNEFVFSASASGGGRSAETSYSTTDGSSSGTSSGYENNSTEGGSSAGREKSNGAAEIQESAGFKAGYQKTTEATETQSTTNHNASINFGSSGSFSTEGTVDIGGGDFTMDEMSIDATNVASTKNVDETKTTTSKTEEFWGVQGEGHSAAADAANKYTAMGVEAAEGDKDTNGGEVAASVIGDGTNIIFNDMAGGSYTMGYERTDSSSTTVSGKENITNINVGNLTIKSKENTELNGVEVNADSVNIDVGGDLDINSAKSWEYQDSWSATNSVGLSHGAGAGATGAGIGASYDYRHYEEQANSQSVTHTNSHINAGNITVSVGGDMTIAGANIAADEADINVGGDLNIISQQDTYDSTESSWQTSVSVGAAISTSGIIPTFNAGGGYGSGYRNEALVNEQSGITTSGSMKITTGNDLNITGGHIISEDGSGSVNVGGDLNDTTLEDYIEQDGLYGGASVGVDKKGTFTAGGYVKTIDEIHYKENQKATVDVGTITTNGEINGELNTYSSNMNEVTEDTVTAGNDISWTLGGSNRSKGKGSGSASTPTTDSASNTGSGTNNGSGTNTGSDTNTGSGSSTNTGTGSDVSNSGNSSANDKTPGNSTTPDSGNKLAESPTNVPNQGNSSASDSSTGNSTTTDNNHTPAESPTNVPNQGNSSASDSSTGNSTTTDNSHTPAESPTNVPNQGNSSASDSSTGNSTITDNSHTPAESPTNVPNQGNSSASDSSTDNSTTVTPGAGNNTDTGNGTGVAKKPKSKWTISPQGNLKGGYNVGTIKDTDAIRKSRERWKSEYESRNSLKNKDEELSLL